MKHNANYIYGKHAVMLAINNKANVISELYIAKGIDLTKAQKSALEKYGVILRGLNPAALPKEIAEESVHQGMVAVVKPERLMDTFEHYMAETTPTADTCVVLLGEVQDPQNVGAIIRSAAAFGASAVMIPEHNQAPVNGTVVKVSAGMAFAIPLVKIGNVNEAMRQLKEAGYWTYGMAGESKHSITTEQFDAPTVFVVGNEGAGIRTKTRDECDIMLSIPMNPQCESLNVATSASLALHQWAGQHPRALK